LADNGELKTDIVIETEKDFAYSVTCLIPYSHGFICGLSNGAIHLYERVEDKDLFRRSKDIMTNDQQIGIKSISLSPSEDILAVTLENCQIFGFTLSNSDKDSTAPIFSNPYHHGAIIGLDTCIRKPYVITTSADHSVRVWNYLENTCEFVKYFGEEIHCVAIHPSGFSVMIGFNDKLRMMSLLSDEMRLLKEFPIRVCRECRFSNGGQYFAAVNGNTIQVFSSWTFALISTMKGHIGKVRSIYWTEDDLSLVTSGMDGAIYEWNVLDGRRKSENVLKSNSYYSAVFDSASNQMYGVGSDSTLKVIQDSQIIREYASPVTLTQIVLSGKMLVAGTANGSIYAFKYPLDGDNFEFQEHVIHSGSVSRLRTSFDGEYLFSAGDDGSVFISKLTDKESKHKRYDNEHVFSTEVRFLV
jgi:WD40 repeat protein